MGAIAEGERTIYAAFVSAECEKASFQHVHEPTVTWFLPKIIHYSYWGYPEDESVVDDCH